MCPNIERRRSLIGSLRVSRPRRRLATNLVVYFERFAGANASAAAANVGLWGGSCYLTPLLGAWVADSYLGRYHTILLFTLIYLAVRPPASLRVKLHSGARHEERQRVDLVGSHGRWKRPRLQTAHMAI